MNLTNDHSRLSTRSIPRVCHGVGQIAPPLSVRLPCEGDIKDSSDKHIPLAIIARSGTTGKTRKIRSTAPSSMPGPSMIKINNDHQKSSLIIIRGNSRDLLHASSDVQLQLDWTSCANSGHTQNQFAVRPRRL